LPLEKTFILPFKIQGMQKDHFVRWRMITPNYFKALRIPLRQGRYFTEGDSGSSPAVALINETMARQYFPNKDPIGELLTLSNLGGAELGDQPRQIVGVVGDVRDGDLIEPVPPGVYVPDSQVPDGRMRFFNRILPVNFVIRTGVDPLGMASAVKREILAVDSEQPLFYVRSLEQIKADSISGQKFQMILVGIFSAAALILAAVGIYGVMAYSVSTRMGEIGIRMALGARSRDVLKLIIGQGLILALLGLALGLAGALALTRLIAGLLFGVSATDPLTFVVVALLLILVALLASYLPARRATKVDPLLALRHE
jgi:predicted permease